MKKVLIVVPFAGTSLPASATQTTHFVIEVSYSSFEPVDTSDQVVDFDVDLANALCKEIDVTCTFTNQASNSLTPGPKFRRLGAVATRTDIMPEREKRVLFSTLHYDNPVPFVGQQGKFTSADQLKGKKVSVRNNTTHQKLITDKHPEITTAPHDSHQNAELDLQSGRIDVIFGDIAVITERLKSNPRLVAVDDKVIGKTYFDTGLGIAIHQGNTNLQQKFNAALEKMKEDGTYQTIYNKWLQR